MKRSNIQVIIEASSEKFKLMSSDDIFDFMTKPIGIAFNKYKIIDIRKCGINMSLNKSLIDVTINTKIPYNKVLIKNKFIYRILKLFKKDYNHIPASVLEKIEDEISEDVMNRLKIIITRYPVYNVKTKIKLVKEGEKWLNEK